jgi:hypothetical protein
VALAAPANARKFQMSGHWVIRNAGIFLPLQFAATVMGVKPSMGSLTLAFGFANVVPFVLPATSTV